ncbi:MAG: Holliday junction resolvase RecU [Mycoplasmataceae bacterium]|nr:Holliday junction resolvase RecU [Mycoplasmataceae bacterium]
MNNNRGMLLETIINKTIKQYKENDVAIFHKKTLDIKFSNVNAKNKIDNGVIMSKSTVDYYGIYNGSFVAFEAKSTESIIVPKNNFKLHQHNYLKTIKKHGGIAFYIILFKTTNEFYLIDVTLVDYNKKLITLEFVRKNGCSLDLIFPGVIDFISSILFN